MAKNAERGKLFLPYKTLNGFEELVRIMSEHDRKLARRERILKEAE